MVLFLELSRQPTKYMYAATYISYYEYLIWVLIIRNWTCVFLLYTTQHVSVWHFKLIFLCYRFDTCE